MSNTQQYGGTGGGGGTAGTTGGISGETQSTGKDNAATVSVDDKKFVSAAWDVTGSATIRVEISNDGSDWYKETEISASSNGTGAYNFTTAFDEARIWVDQNLDQAEISAKA